MMRCCRQASEGLRHTFCKALADAGVPLDRVAVLAGHAGLDTAARYTRPTMTDLERAVRRLDAKL
jgi:site-specific recombinase XerD